MGYFDKIEQKDLDALKEELYSSIAELDKKIMNKASDDEASTRTAAENSEKLLIQIKNNDSTIEGYLVTIRQQTEKIKAEHEILINEHTTLKNKNTELLNKIDESNLIFGNLKNSQDSINKTTQKVQSDVEIIDKALIESESLPSHLSNVKELLENAKELDSDMSDLLSHSMKRKSDIDALYKDINGHDITNENNEVEHIEGIKDELQRSFDDISQQESNLREKIKETTKSLEHEYEEILDNKTQNFDDLISDSKKKVQAVSQQLSGLLPGAMAEGLSAAYEEKRKTEVKEQSKLESTFKLSIIMLVAISSIPLIFDIYLLIFKDKALTDIINEAPSLLMLVLPLYFPILWLAYSTNKKLNLSKRLIEEYTHKSVLGKTFDGLSNQIESLPQDGPVRDELRTRLLFNLLQVSSENPGKLITNYDKSDHPLMEALENSSKLSDSVSALMRLPGFSTMAGKLADKSEKILEEESRRIKKGLEVQESLETKERIDPVVNDS